MMGINEKDDFCQFMKVKKRLFWPFLRTLSNNKVGLLS
jgi:hypothetical protein